MTNKTTLQTLELPISQRHILDVPALGTGSACVLGINSYQLPTSFFNFVGQHLQETSPRSISDGFSEMMIFNHIFDLKFFNTNNFKLFDNVKRSFMQEILSLVENPLMKSCNFKSGFSSVRTSFFLPTQSSLKSSEFLLTFPQELRILNSFSIRKDSETFNPNINSNMIIWDFDISNRDIFTTENSKPPESSFFNTESFEFSLRNSMQDNRNISNLTYENSFIRNKFKSTLRVGYGFISIQILKSGKTNLSFFLFNSYEEMIKSIINSFGNVLLNLTMNRNIKIFCEFVQVELSKTSLIGFVSIHFGFEKFVIDKTTIRNGLIQFDNLILRRIYSISKIHSSKHRLPNKNTFIYIPIFKKLNNSAIHLCPEGQSILASDNKIIRSETLSEEDAKRVAAFYSRFRNCRTPRCEVAIDLWGGRRFGRELMMRFKK